MLFAWFVDAYGDRMSLVTRQERNTAVPLPFTLVGLVQFVRSRLTAGQWCDQCDAKLICLRLTVGWNDQYVATLICLTGTAFAAPSGGAIFLCENADWTQWCPCSKVLHSFVSFSSTVLHKSQ